MPVIFCNKILKVLVNQMQGYSGSINEDNIYYGRQDMTEPYFINCCGYLKSSGIDISLKRIRCDFYIIYLINGIGHYHFNKTLYSIDAGNIILYKPGEEQDYYYIGNENAELYWIHFTGSEAASLLSRLSLSDRNYYKVGIDSDYVNIFESIIREIQIRKPQYHQICIGLLIQLLALFSRKPIMAEKGEGAFDVGLENVIKCMHSKFHEDHPMDYYAKMCNLSVYQFIRSFRNAIQLPPGKYIGKLRISKAKELLANTNLTINEISGLIGYNDPFYFSKAFKKSTNTTPTSYRNTMSSAPP